MMRKCLTGNSMMGSGMLFSVICFVIIVALIVAIIMVLKKNQSQPKVNGNQKSLALKTLEERFAKGEIDEVEFKTKRSILQD